MASIIDICNMALGMIGVGDITSLNDSSKESKACKLAWPIVRDEILRSHPWNCATKRVSLTPLVDTPEFNWDYQYQLPSDCLRVIKVNPESQYQVEQRKVLSNEIDLQIEYIFRQEDPTAYDSALVSAFSYSLASKIAYQFNASTSQVDYLSTQAEDKLADARSADAREGTPEDPRPASWLQAKLGRTRKGV